MIAPVIACGNTVVALASERFPYPAVLLGEMLATSDLPGGVVNILTGFRRELVPTFATHAHLRAVYAAAEGDDRRALRLGAAASVKRVRFADRGHGSGSRTRRRGSRRSATSSSSRPPGTRSAPEAPGALPRGRATHSSARSDRSSKGCRRRRPGL